MTGIEEDGVKESDTIPVQLFLKGMSLNYTLSPNRNSLFYGEEG